MIPASLVSQISKALAADNDIDLSNAIQNIVGTNAGTNNNLAAAITGLATSLAPNRGGAITTGALLGAGPGAASIILNTVANTSGVNFTEVVADVNTDPQIPPETKQASNEALVASTQPAAGPGPAPAAPQAPLPLTFLPVTPGTETAENPNQVVGTNPAL